MFATCELKLTSKVSRRISDADPDNVATSTSYPEPPMIAALSHDLHFLGPETAHLSHRRASGVEYNNDDEDDDLYDVEDDDEEDDDDDDDDDDYEVRELDQMMLDPDGQSISPRAHISNIIAPLSKHLNEHSRISFRSFLPDRNTLTNYHPSMGSSPLMNSTTAKIFCHFIYVLGPSLSLFERQPPNPHVAFTPGAGLQGPQNVWSYTVPMLSLSHPPLMHAILALSSLHISKLTKGPSHPSLLHYHIALRRLGKAIASDRHRSHVATLSATLLLGYYETMAAEHDKWSSHIHGAKQLLKEIDFDRVARRVEILDEQDRISQQQQREGGGLDGEQQQYLQTEGQLWPPPPPQPGQQPSVLRLRKMRKQQVYNDADEKFASMLSGHGRAARNRGVRRGGQQKEGGGGGGGGGTAARTTTTKELDVMQLQADMFWWFAKMDCYQSLVSGCPLV